MKILRFALCSVLLCSAFAKAYAQEEVTIQVIPVQNQIYMLQGRGGNIGLSIGEDGVFMIDDQFANLSDKILTAIRTLSDQPLRFLVNTHHHGDHTGGNANFKEAGALLVAHDNVRGRLTENSKGSKAALPIITFSEDMTLFLNDNDILVTHVHNAHTDGDALVYFTQSNVLHTGDTFFNGRFPYIDLKSGGSLSGDIAAAKRGLQIINEDTKIIPGHGSIASKADYQAYYEMLIGIKEQVSKAIAEGKSEEEVAQMESLTSIFYTDAEMADNFITGERIRRTAYQSLVAEQQSN
ncbi:MBL fold metallo-hydrolase [Croceiramulus getboli]|nr:MBL fold metallo-hydrolase [Flavobacteriaceae bacterium YJPT1-3]